MVKKIVSLMLAVAMLASLNVVGVSAETDSLTVGGAMYFAVDANGQKTAIDAPTAGTIATNVKVYNQGTNAENAVLIVATYASETAELVSVNLAQDTVNAGKVATLSANVNLAEGDIHRYFVWDGLNTLTPVAIDLTAPAAPTNLAARNITTSTIDLSWDASADALKYYVYRNSVKIAEITTTSFKDYGLEDGTTYTYQVSAINALNEAKSASITATTAEIATIDFTNVDVTTEVSGYIGTKTQGKLQLIGARSTGTYVNGALDPNHYDVNKSVAGNTSADNFWTIQEYAGKTCYANSKAGADNQVFGMRVSVDDSFITASDNVVTLLFTYYDNGTMPIQIRYSNNSGSTTLVSVLNPKTNTNTWKTVAYTINNANFENGNIDLFILNRYSENLYISEIGVAKNYVEKQEFVPVLGQPSAPTNIIADNITTSTIGLSWTAATDDVAVTGYKVYRNNVLIGTVDGTSFVDSGLDHTTEYTYIVSAMDEEGNETKSAPITATTAEIATIDFTNVDVTTEVGGYIGTKTQGKLQLIGARSTGTYVNGALDPNHYDVNKSVAGNTSADNFWTIQEYAGKTCYANSKAGADNQVFGMRVSVDDNFITANDDVVTLFFTYYDNGTMSIQIRYNADSNAAKLVSVLNPKTNTNTWKTVAYTINDANFTNGTIDFFILNRYSENLYISEVGVAKNYVPKSYSLEPANSVIGIESLAYEFNGFLSANKAEECGIVNNVGNENDKRTAFFLNRTDSSSSVRLGVKVPATYITADDRKVLIRITYFDKAASGDDNGRLCVDYAGIRDGAVANIYGNTVPFVGDNRWKTHEFLIDNAAFNSTYSGYGTDIDFRINSTGATLHPINEPLYISKIEVIKI